MIMWVSDDFVMVSQDPSASSKHRTGRACILGSLSAPESYVDSVPGPWKPLYQLQRKEQTRTLEVYPLTSCKSTMQMVWKGLSQLPHDFA